MIKFFYILYVLLVFFSCQQKSKDSDLPKLQFDLKVISFDYHDISYSDYFYDTKGVIIPEKISLDFDVKNLSDSIVSIPLKSVWGTNGWSLYLNKGSREIDLIGYKRKMEIEPQKSLNLREYISYKDYDEFFKLYRGLTEEYLVENKVKINLILAKDSLFSLDYPIELNNNFNTKLYFADSIIDNIQEYYEFR